MEAPANALTKGPLVAAAEADVQLTSDQCGQGYVCQAAISDIGSTEAPAAAANSQAYIDTASGAAATEQVPRLHAPSTTEHRTVEKPSRQVCTAWMDAAKEGDVLELRRLHSIYPSLLNHQTGGLQCTAAHWAAANGHVEVLQQLAKLGADLSLLTATGCLPLHSAAAAGKAATVELLLSLQQQQQLHVLNEDGLTPAALALCHGHKVVHGMLLQASAAGPASAAAQDAPAVSLTVTPAVLQAPPAAHTSKQEQQDPQLQQQESQGIRRGFLLGSSKSTVGSHQAVDGQSVQLASRACSSAGRRCGSNNVDVVVSNMKEAHAAGPAGPTVLPSTPEDQPASTSSSSSSSGSGCTTTNKQETLPLQQQQQQQQQIDRSMGRRWLDATRAGDLSCLQALLACEPRLLSYRGAGTSYAFTGNSALHWAAAKGHVDIVAWLLGQQHGADAGACELVSLVNEAGGTALHTAVEHGQGACAEVLVLQGGANVGLQDGLGQTAVAMAAGAAAGAGRCGGAGQLSGQLLLWELVRKLRAVDRLTWCNADMQQLLRLANKATEAARCLEKAELVALAAEVLQGFE